MNFSMRDTFGNSPIKNAYVYLNVIKPLSQAYQAGDLSKWSNYRSDTNFQEFKTAIEQEKLVSTENIREVDKAAKNHVTMNMNYSGNISFFNDVNTIFEKAYHLGMIDKKGRLLQAYEASI